MSSYKVYKSSCQIVIKLIFPQQDFEKLSYIKFNSNSSSGSRLVPCWQTEVQTDRERDDEANNLFSQFYERA